MHIKGYIAISMRYVACNLVPFTDFASSGSMPHGNNYGSLNMHAIDIVSILMDSLRQWQYYDIYTRAVACMLRAI